MIKIHGWDKKKNEFDYQGENKNTTIEYFLITEYIQENFS